MQWSGAENAGFTTGTPWLKVNPNYKTINADIEDPLAIGEAPILCNYPDQPLLGRLRPYEARIYLKSQEENP